MLFRLLWWSEQEYQNDTLIIFQQINRAQDPGNWTHLSAM